jgi:hypothetical protein
VVLQVREAHLFVLFSTRNRKPVAGFFVRRTALTKSDSGGPMETAELTVANVAKIAGCHLNTVKRYERCGYIKSYRDINGYRRFSRQDASKLKEMLAIRKPYNQQEMK